MKRIVPSLIFLFSILFLSCQQKSSNCPAEALTPCGAEAQKVNVRILNKAAYAICNVKLLGRDGQEANYGTLKTGQMSCYQSFESIYSTGYKELYTRGKKYVDKAIDYTDDELLPPGYYTFEYELISHGIIHFIVRKD